jgi:hypothetical protein
MPMFEVDNAGEVNLHDNKSADISFAKVENVGTLNATNNEAGRAERSGRSEMLKEYFLKPLVQAIIAAVVAVLIGALMYKFWPVLKVSP